MCEKMSTDEKVDFVLKTLGESKTAKSVKCKNELQSSRWTKPREQRLSSFPILDLKSWQRVCIGLARDSMLILSRKRIPKLQADRAT